MVKHIAETGINPYTFDRVFQPETTQQEIYVQAAQPITDAVLQGYNGTIFAYGQTSSGKTFTMTGNPDNLYDEEIRGIIPRTVEGLFEGINEADENTTFTLAVQYVEIYMERVRDLLVPEVVEAQKGGRRNSMGGGGGRQSMGSGFDHLDPNSFKNNLPITEDENGVPGIPGAEKIYVSSQDEIYDLLSRGNGGRATSSTNMNQQSSRSHAVFILTVEQSSPEFSKKGVLYLVDLAGSEKIKNTGAKGMRLDEAKKINMSLSTLGRVINKLTSGSMHVPYRDSKLTRLLQQSLGGNAKTTLLICCSPATANTEETRSTLEFGMRAKRIKNKAKVNSERSREEMMRMLKRCEQIIDALKRRVDELEGRTPAEVVADNQRRATRAAHNGDGTRGTSGGGTSGGGTSGGGTSGGGKTLDERNESHQRQTSSTRELALMNELDALNASYTALQHDLDGLEKQQQRAAAENRQLHTSTNIAKHQANTKVSTLQTAIMNELTEQKTTVQDMKRTTVQEMELYSSEILSLKKAMLSVVAEITLEQQRSTQHRAQLASMAHVHDQEHANHVQQEKEWGLKTKVLQEEIEAKGTREEELERRVREGNVKITSLKLKHDSVVEVHDSTVHHHKVQLEQWRLDKSQEKITMENEQKQQLDDVKTRLNGTVLLWKRKEEEGRRRVLLLESQLSTSIDAQHEQKEHLTTLQSKHDHNIAKTTVLTTKKEELAKALHAQQSTCLQLQEQWEDATKTNTNLRQDNTAHLERLTTEHQQAMAGLTRAVAQEQDERARLEDVVAQHTKGATETALRQAETEQRHQSQVLALQEALRQAHSKMDSITTISAFNEAKRLELADTNKALASQVQALTEQHQDHVKSSAQQQATIAQQAETLLQNKQDVQKLCQKIKTESLHHLSDYKKSTEQLLAVQNKYQSLVKTHAALDTTHAAHLLECNAVKKENVVLSNQNSRVHTELST